MELIFELIVWFIIEVLFWGIMFWTGYAIIQTVTLGQWKPGSLGKNKEKRKENRKEAKFIVVAIIGALFWLGLGIAAIVIIKNP